MDAEVVEIDDLRREAGIAALIGADGQAVLDAVGEAQVDYAETELPALVEELGIYAAGAAGRGRIAGISSPADNDVQSTTFDWEPSFSGRTAYTISMMTAIFADSISSADTDRAPTPVTSNKTTETTTGDIRERNTVRTIMTLQTGQGRIEGEVELVTTTEATSVSTGAPIGTFVATATGEIDVNACPDPDGVAEGRISMEWREDFGGAAGSAGGTASFDAPIRMLDGDDAHLIHTEVDLSFSKAAHGPGTPGGNPGAPFDWSYGGSMSVVVPRGGQVSVSNVAETAGNGASPAQAASASAYALTQVSLIVFQVAEKAERFWRGGKCVEVQTSEESRDVDPEEEVPITIEGKHKFDGAQVEGKAETTFTGLAEIRPTEPITTPDEVTFVAGERPDDEGRLEIKHTSKRGIGNKTLVFIVAGGLFIEMEGKIDVDPQNISTITVSQQEMTLRDDGVYELETSATASGTYGIPGCVDTYSAPLPIRIEVRPDTGSDPPTANIRVALDGGTGLLSFQQTCDGITTLAPVGLLVWPASFITPTGPGSTVPVDEPTTLVGLDGEVSTEVNLTTSPD